MKIKIINLLSKGDLTKKELLEILKIHTKNEEEIFYRIVHRLMKNKSIISVNGKYHLDNNPLASMGVFSLSKEGFGFIDTKFESFYVHPRNTFKALTGDKVKYQIIRKSRDSRKSEAAVLEILERKSQDVVGEIIESKGKELFDFKPYSHVNMEFKIINNINLTIGDVVAGKILEMDKQTITLEITKVIGQIGDNDIDIKQVLFEKGIPIAFSSASKEQASHIEIDWELEKRTRKDLTKENIITIDGEDAKDLDDAIMIKKQGENYLLSISIADVSYFVPKDSPLDADAYKRGTSVYLVNTVIPMLPKEISNNLSSLNEDGVKLTITCDMTIDNTGKTLSSNIYPSYIKSKGRLTYTEVNTLLNKGTKIKDRSKEINDMLLLGYELSKIIRKKRLNNNMINFNLSEVKIKVDENGEVLNILKKNQDEAEKLIEDFMICANEAIATYFMNKKIPALYRVHEPPLVADIMQFKNMLNSFDFNKSMLKKGPLLNAKGYQAIIDAINDKPFAFIIKKLAIQSMTKAKYDFRNKGHFGLGLHNYTHFTSPIRRYPDLIIHRLLRNHLFDHKKQPIHNNLSDLGIRTSYTEKRAQEAERSLVDKKLSRYMEKFIGDEFVGYITSIQKWGFFVQLENTIEGLVPTKSLDQTYKFDAEKVTLNSEDKKVIYQLGVKVKVVLQNVNTIRGLCDFRVIK